MAKLSGRNADFGVASFGLQRIFMASLFEAYPTRQYLVIHAW